MVGTYGICALNRLCFVGSVGNLTDLHFRIYVYFNSPPDFPTIVNLTSGVNGKCSGSNTLGIYGGIIKFNNNNYTNNNVNSNSGIFAQYAKNESKLSYNTFLNNTTPQPRPSAVQNVQTSENVNIYSNNNNYIKNNEYSFVHLQASHSLYIDSCSISQNNFTTTISTSGFANQYYVVISNTYIDDFKPTSGTYPLIFESNISSYTNFLAPITVNGDGVQVRKTHIYTVAKCTNDNAIAFGIIALKQ